MGNLVKYGEYTVEAAQDEQAEIDASGSGGDFMSISEGRNVVRILPPKAGVRSPFYVVDQHYIKVPGAASAIKFVCPRKSMRKPCPACAKAEEMKRSGNPVDADMAKEFWPRRRAYVNVIDRSDPEHGPKILGCSKTVHESLVNMRQDATAGGDYTHPYKGFDIVITRKGQGLDTEYQVNGARETSKLAPDDQTASDWIEMQHDLTTLVKVHTEEEIRSMLSGKPSQPREERTKGPRARTVQDDAIDTEGEEVT